MQINKVIIMAVSVKLLAVFMVSMLLITSVQADDAGGGGNSAMSGAVCEDANIFSRIFDQVCWDCFLDDLSLFGIGNPPAGAVRNPGPVCTCTDALGVPEMGYPMSWWAPTKLNEVTTIPWCSPSLGGTRLQDTFDGMGYQTTGYGSGGDIDTNQASSAFYQYHYFSYPLMAMMEILALPSCTDGYQDFDMLYISEIDPTWNNDLLALILNPEAIVFGNPLAKAYCAADCVAVTADEAIEETFPCAGCDGSLYPLTGHVNPQPDPVAASSLITQRVLASLHRKGLAHKTIGEDAMCDPEFFPTIPRSQYKFSMIYPIPEASSDGAIDIVGNASSFNDVAGQAGDNQGVFTDCCHPMGMSTARWCTPVGGRIRPGKDKNFVYMIWNYRDCCVRTTGASGGEE